MFQSVVERCCCCCKYFLACQFLKTTWISTICSPGKVSILAVHFGYFDSKTCSFKKIFGVRGGYLTKLKVLAKDLITLSTSIFLLTGFGPFGTHHVNASIVAVKVHSHGVWKEYTMYFKIKILVWKSIFQQKMWVFLSICLDFILVRTL